MIEYYVSDCYLYFKTSTRKSSKPELCACEDCMLIEFLFAKVDDGRMRHEKTMYGQGMNLRSDLMAVMTEVVACYSQSHANSLFMFSPVRPSACPSICLSVVLPVPFSLSLARERAHTHPQQKECTCANTHPCERFCANSHRIARAGMRQHSSSHCCTRDCMLSCPFYQIRLHACTGAKAQT